MFVIGSRFDRYIIEGEAGSGGLATVYRVRHTTLGSLHALKVLHMEGRSLRGRLVQEGRVQASLRHPNIVAVTDVIDVDGAPGLVMEYIDGPTLDEWLQLNRPDLATSEALFRGILAGVARAHSAGLVHRDLKPANVLLDSSSGSLIPKVADFGLAKAIAEAGGEGGGAAGADVRVRTRTGVAMGTPQFMSPEQIRDAKGVDQRTDVFALGAILYEMVCGKPAFEGADMLAVFNAVASGSYVAPEQHVPGLPPRVRASIVGCLVTDRGGRIPDCGVLAAVLEGSSGEEWQSGHLGAARSPPESMRVEGARTAVPGVSSDGEAASDAPPGPEPSAPQEIPPPRSTFALTWFGREPNGAEVAEGAEPGADVDEAPEAAGGADEADWPGAADAADSAEGGARTGLRGASLVAVGLAAVVLLVAGIGLVGVAAAWWFLPVDPATVVAEAQAPPTVPEVAPEGTAAPKGAGAPTNPSGPSANVRPASPASGAGPSGINAPGDASAPGATESSTTPSSTAPVASAAVPVAAPAAAPAAPPVAAAASPASTPAIPTGTVVVSGNADRVWLVGKQGRVAPGVLPAGDYTISASFKGGPLAGAGRVSVRAGAVVTIECTADLLTCREVRGGP